MGIVINVTPNLRLRPEWLTAEIDFDYELSKQAAGESHGVGIRTAASRDFEGEMQWAVDRWIAWMEKKGYIFFGPKGGPLVDGPFLPRNFDNNWPRGGDDGQELPRKQEKSVEETGGRVCYRLAAIFLVREYIHSELVERGKDEERYKAVKNARKENGLWIPQKPSPPAHYPV